MTLTSSVLPQPPGIRAAEFAGRRILVVGMARSGLAAAEVLRSLDADVRLYDDKPADEIDAAIESANRLGLTPLVGGSPVDYGDFDLVVTSPGVRRNAAVLQNARTYGLPVIGEIEAAYRIARAPLIAVTGTNGKTTTVLLAEAMLREAGITAAAAGNIAAGSVSYPLIKAALEMPEEGVIVAEISSFQLEWVERFRPKSAAILNITPDHGDRQTPAEYAAAKWRIFAGQTATDTAVLPASLASDSSAAFLRGGIVVFDDGDIDARVRALTGPDGMRLEGRHNRLNVLAAAALTAPFGVDDRAAGAAARTFSGAIHRLEPIAQVDGVRYVNNSMCTNDAAFAESLAALAGPKVVIMGGVYKGDDPGALAAAVLKHDVQAVVLIGRSAPTIAAALQGAGYEDITFSSSMEQAVEAARSRSAGAKTVVLAPACASFDMFKDFEDRGEQFRAAVLALPGSVQIVKHEG